MVFGFCPRDNPRAYDWKLINMVHLKDFIRENGSLKSVAAGTGEMDYSAILSFLKARKPYVMATLENTDDTNAVWSREHIENLYSAVI